jgi:hypothetical protein
MISLSSPFACLGNCPFPQTSKPSYAADAAAGNDLALGNFSVADGIKPIGFGKRAPHDFAVQCPCLIPRDRGRGWSNGIRGE